jgi:hypothetical protein
LAKKGTDGSLFERFMIIVFGAAIVLLGAYPLSREYGGVRNYISAKLAQVGSYIDSDASTAKRGRLGTAEKPAAPSRSKDRSSASSPNQKPMDDLSNDDRKQLDSLIQSVVN